MANSGQAGLRVPQYAYDFYSDDFIRESWPHCAAMRKLGPVVYIPELDNYPMTRHAEVWAALRDFERFESRHGVVGDAFGCDLLQGNSVASAPPQHTTLRRTMEPPLQRRALQDVQGQIQAATDALVVNVPDGLAVDANPGLAQSLPLTVVRDMVGLPPFE